jgi:holo-[acyl-carrier-protein] synthase
MDLSKEFSLPGKSAIAKASISKPSITRRVLQGTGFRDGMSWQDVEVENDELGKPQLQLAAAALEKFKNKKLQSVFLSLSHTKDMAVAMVIIE